MTTKTQPLSTATKEDRAALDIIFAAEAKKQEVEKARTAKALAAWRSRYQTERTRVIGAELQRKLHDYAAARKLPSLTPGEDDPARLQEARTQRHASFRFAHELGLNWAALAELNDKAAREVRQIVTPRRVLPTFGDVQLTEPKPTEPQPLPQPGRALGPLRAAAAPRSVSAAAYSPPYPGWWERLWQSAASGNGRIERNDSYLWADWTRMGSLIGARNYSAGNVDYLSAYRENGYLVPYTPTQNGYLEVQFDLECAVCQHSIWLSNEWGWSDCTSWTNEAAVMSVFWSWEDFTPASEGYDIGFVYGLDGNGNGDHYPGGATPALPGQRRTVTLYTTSSFTAGTPLWLYVGSQQRLFAWLNDVSADLWVNSAWYVTGIRVRSV